MSLLPNTLSNMWNSTLKNLCRQYISHKTVNLHALLVKYECFHVVNLQYKVFIDEMRQFTVLCNIIVPETDFSKVKMFVSICTGQKQGLHFGTILLEIRGNKSLFISASIRAFLSSSPSGEEVLLTTMHSTNIGQYLGLTVKCWIKIPNSLHFDSN